MRDDSVFTFTSVIIAVLLCSLFVKLSLTTTCRGLAQAFVLKNKIVSTKSVYIDTCKSDFIMHKAKKSRSTLTCGGGRAVTISATSRMIGEQRCMAWWTHSYDLTADCFHFRQKTDESHFKSGSCTRILICSTDSKRLRLFQTCRDDCKVELISIIGIGGQGHCSTFVVSLVSINPCILKARLQRVSFVQTSYWFLWGVSSKHQQAKCFS